MSFTYNPTTFNGVLRYLIQAARDKRVVMYHELENAFGLSHNMVGYYAGLVGSFCLENDQPLLNALVISPAKGCPSEGFDPYMARYNEEMEGEGEDWDWGDLLAECWKHYHVGTSREQQVRYFSGLNQVVRDWMPPEDLLH